MTTTKSNREFELKFRARPQDLARFKKAVNAAAGNRRVWPERQLLTQYFDTESFDLQKSCVSVRLRKSANKTVQTVKAAGSGNAGIMDRLEWEQTVTGEALDLDALPDEARQAMGGISADALQPIMDVSIRRQTMMIRRANPLGPDLVIEAAADKGSVRVGEQIDEFVECELELVEGDINMFFHVAAEIHAACPLPLSNLTKSGRGYRLLRGEAMTSQRLEKFELHAAQTVHQALASIYPACIANIIDNEEPCIDGRDPEAVHQMRISVRRLRSSLKVFQHYIDPARIAWMADDLRWLGNCLGPARDWDVYITEILPGVSGYGIDEAHINRLIEAATSKRAEAYAVVRNTLHSKRYAKMMFHLTAFVGVEGWMALPVSADNPLLLSLGDKAASILGKAHRKLLKDGKNLADMDIVARHAVRIRLKKLRYAVEFLRGVYPGGETRKYIKALQSLQDQFGHLNDVAQAMHLTETLTHPQGDASSDTMLSFTGGLVQGWYAHAFHDTEPQLLRNWQNFEATKPFWEQKA